MTSILFSGTPLYTASKMPAVSITYKADLSFGSSLNLLPPWPEDREWLKDTDQFKLYATEDVISDPEVAELEPTPVTPEAFAALGSENPNQIELSELSAIQERPEEKSILTKRDSEDDPFMSAPWKRINTTPKVRAGDHDTGEDDNED